jgi:hypothetical protein
MAIAPEEPVLSCNTLANAVYFTVRRPARTTNSGVPGRGVHADRSRQNKVRQSCLSARKFLDLF